MKFLLNLPDSELQTSERLFFQIEQAHWYYEDFLADAPNSGLPHMGLRVFALRLFENSELLKPLRSMYDEFFRDFMSYKGKIPTYGCIMLNPTVDKMVLVCNWKGTSWGFPKGKLNEGEDGSICAAREVEEECGYKPTGLTEEDSITVVLDGGQRCKMFIVPGVQEDTYFEPIARKEISKIQFFPIDSPPNRAWNVDKFTPRLKRWIKSYRKKLRRQEKSQQQAQQQQQRQGQEPATYAETGYDPAYGLTAHTSGPPGYGSELSPAMSSLFGQATSNEVDPLARRDEWQLLQASETSVGGPPTAKAAPKAPTGDRFAFDISAIMAAVDAAMIGQQPTVAKKPPKTKGGGAKGKQGPAVRGKSDKKPRVRVR